MRKPTNQAIGERIVEMRKALGITPKDLAEKIGVTVQAVSNWENGKGVKRENLQLIAARYGVSLDWLAAGKGTMSPVLGYWDLLIEEEAHELTPEERANLREDFKYLVQKAKERRRG